MHRRDISHFGKASLQMIDEYDSPPTFNWFKYPEEEREHVSLINTDVRLLDLHTSTFNDAVALTEHCHQLRHQKSLDEMTMEDMPIRRQFANWQMLASRDAAFSIYHFRASLISSRDQLKLAPSLKEKVDTKGLEAAYKRFCEEFPLAKDLRNTVGHWADMIFSNKEKKKHYADNGPVIINAYNGTLRRLTMMRNKEQLSLDVTADTLNRLVSIKRDAWVAFHKADAQYHEA